MAKTAEGFKTRPAQRDSAPSTARPGASRMSLDPKIRAALTIPAICAPMFPATGPRWRAEVRKAVSLEAWVVQR